MCRGAQTRYIKIRLPESRVNLVRGAMMVTSIAQEPDTCRAEASSMPEGPAVGRVEAKRRALTTLSTARD